MLESVNSFPRSVLSPNRNHGGWKGMFIDIGPSQAPSLNIALSLWLCQNSYWTWPIYSGFTYYKRWFSIAMSTFTRGYHPPETDSFFLGTGPRSAETEPHCQWPKRTKVTVPKAKPEIKSQNEDFWLRSIQKCQIKWTRNVKTQPEMVTRYLIW